MEIGHDLSARTLFGRNTKHEWCSLARTWSPSPGTVANYSSWHHTVVISFNECQQHHGSDSVLDKLKFKWMWDIRLRANRRYFHGMTNSKLWNAIYWLISQYFSPIRSFRQSNAYRLIFEEHNDQTKNDETNSCLLNPFFFFIYTLHLDGALVCNSTSLFKLHVASSICTNVNAGYYVPNYFVKAGILQTIRSNIFKRTKYFVFWMELHWLLSME